MAAYFNSGVQTAARDITRNLGNVARQMEDGDRNKTEGNNIFKILKAWGNDGRRVPADADERQVKREMGAFLRKRSQGTASAALPGT